MRLQEILRAVPTPKTLTIRDLEALDDADLKAVHEAQTPVKLQDEAA